MNNTNVLVDMACPKCDGVGPFRIASHCWAVVHDDGVEETTEHEWDDADACVCLDPACGFHGHVRDFKLSLPGE